MKQFYRLHSVQEDWGQKLHDSDWALNIRDQCINQRVDPRWSERGERSYVPCPLLEKLLTSHFLKGEEITVKSPFSPKWHKVMVLKM